MDNESISLMIIVFCVVMSAYFSATEMAFSSLNRIRVKNMAEKGNRRAALVLKMSDNYDVLLSTILIGNNIVNIASASLATVLFVRLLGDEAGASVSTIVTTEDILEELVGEIWDEHDEVIQEIKKVSGTEYLVAGSASIDKLFDELHKKQDYEFVTVSGWVMEMAGRIPVQGDCFTYENLEVTVTKMDEKRVEQVRIIVR